MSDNFTPLPSLMSTPPQHRSVSSKQVVAGILTLGLLVAIGSGFFLVNRVQNTATKAYSTDECVAQGGFEWAANCPPNTTSIGNIRSTQDGGGRGQPGPGLGDGDTVRVCCKPVTVTTQVTDTPPDIVVSSPPPNITASLASPPPTIRVCKLPQVAIDITCPNGCVAK